MFSIGDLVLVGASVGTVIDVDDERITYGSWDGNQYVCAQKDCTLICDYKTTLNTFERSVLDATRNVGNSK